MMIYLNVVLVPIEINNTVSRRIDPPIQTMFVILLFQLRATFNTR